VAALARAAIVSAPEPELVALLRELLAAQRDTAYELRRIELELGELARRQGRRLPFETLAGRVGTDARALRRLVRRAER
jgi:hypothetical protein